MSSIKFRIKGNNNNSHSSIYARMYYNGIETEVKTGFQVKQSDWSKTKSKVKLTKQIGKEYDKINDGLKKLEKFFFDEINIAQSEEIDITKSWLKGLIPRCFNQTSKTDKNNIEVYFIPYVNAFIEQSKVKERPNGKKLSHRTIQDYQGTVKKLLHFEEIIWKNQLTHLDITVKFNEKFISFCRDYHGIKDKTIGGEIDNIKLFCRNAKHDGIKICEDYSRREFRSPDNETNDFALTEKEIKKLELVDLSRSEKLQNARDWLIIGIWTGLRVGDLLDLNTSNIDEDFISVTNKKTNIPVIIPIHKSVKQILHSRDNKFPRKISSQKFNEYIKEVGQIAGLKDLIQGGKMMPIKIKGYGKKDTVAYRKQSGKYPKYKLLTSHCCRRTFATFHYGKLDTLTIMNITGHKTEKQFLEYVKITPKRHAKAMKEMWNKYYKDAD